MKFIFKLQKSSNTKTYYSFTLIELTFINTFQVWSINITLCNLFIQVLHEKQINKH